MYRPGPPEPGRLGEAMAAQLFTGTFINITITYLRLIAIN